MTTMEPKTNNISWRSEMQCNVFVITITCTDMKIPAETVILQWVECHYNEAKKMISDIQDTVKGVQFRIEYPEINIGQFDDKIADLKDAQTIRRYIAESTDSDDVVIPGLVGINIEASCIGTSKS